MDSACRKIQGTVEKEMIPANQQEALPDAHDDKMLK